MVAVSVCLWIDLKTYPPKNKFRSSFVTSMIPMTSSSILSHSLVPKILRENTSLRTALSDIGLSLSNIVGCTFDGAQNMRSAACGLNFHIKPNNSNCLYVWCLSHQFNLVVKVATGGFEHCGRDSIFAKM